MTQSVALLPIARGRFNHALKEAAQLYPNGYADRFIWAGKSWLLCSSGNLLAYPKYFTQLKSSPQGVAVCQQQGRFFLYAWDKTEVVVCFLGGKDKICALLTILLKRKGFSPRVWLDAPARAALIGQFKELPEHNQHSWPSLTDKQQQKMKMYTVKRLSSKPWLGLVSLISLLIFISYGLHSWAPWRDDIEWQDPSLEFEKQLVSTGANIVPLLRLDYNQQLTLQQLLGWRLERIEYRPEQIRYGVRREVGSLSALREYSQQHGFALQIGELNAQLTRAIQLPSAISEPSTMRWHSVTELTDWLDHQLSLWLPASRLKVGKTNRVGNWQHQQITIEIRDYYLPDLLTLAGILDGLPLQLTQGVIHVQSNLLSGQITLQAIGALG